MIIASTNKYTQGTAAQAGIYTRARQMQYKYNIKNEAKGIKISQKTLYFMVFLVVALLFCSWFGMIFFKSVISSVQMDINAVNAEIRAMEQENSILEAEKINALNIESIKKTAETMGMSLPGAYQVEYVDTDDNTANLKIID